MPEHTQNLKDCLLANASEQSQILFVLYFGNNGPRAFRVGRLSSRRISRRRIGSKRGPLWGKRRLGQQKRRKTLSALTTSSSEINPLSVSLMHHASFHHDVLRICWKNLKPCSHLRVFFSQQEYQDELEIQLFSCEIAHRKKIGFE